MIGDMRFDWNHRTDQMSMIQTLCRTYPGDEAWANYAAVFKLSANAGAIRAARALVPQDGELAETLVGVLGHPAAADWLGHPLAAFDGLSPAEVIASHRDGCRIIRHFLMRFPV